MSSPSVTWSEEAVVGVDSSPVASGRSRSVSEPSSVAGSDELIFSAASSPAMESLAASLAACKVEANDDAVESGSPIVPSAALKEDDEVLETSTRSAAAEATASTSTTDLRSVSWAVEVAGDSVGSLSASRSVTWAMSASDSGNSAEIDPQDVYPSTACVFVANLAEPRDDVALEAAVTRAFSRFGTVFVKIRRDHNNLPFAFVQYTTEEEAKDAIERGRGVPIFGRPCRTEMVKSNRSFIIYKRDCSEILIDEAHKIMETFGTVSSIEVVDDDTCERMDLPSSVLVEYSSFNSKKTFSMAVALFPDYYIDMFDVRKRAAKSNIDRDTEFLRQYDLDRRSIYVGGLPLDATEEEMFEIFSDVGEVIKVNMVQRHNQEGALARQFCFVEFDKMETPTYAINNRDGMVLRGQHLTVQRKQSKVAKTRLATRYIGKNELTEVNKTQPHHDDQVAIRRGNFTGQIYNGPNSTANALARYNNNGPYGYDQGHQGYQGHQMPIHHHEPQHYQRYAGPAMPPMPYIPGDGAAVGMSGMPVHPATVSPSFAQSFPVHPPGHTPPGMMSAWPVITNNTPTRHHQAYNPNPAFAPTQRRAPDRSCAQPRRNHTRYFYQPADADIVEE
ncbi:hypothetical protein QC764_120430 [Podospora pseudoanserina]|uniref:RRM domain-containing protein n=1 Tax=Podospora pseudoanserina TaxID=2609844 RepID=A0ABR0IRV6_9PEZI|nr:hypothetical protein QC764_120430 [Podospora pseudoanserina]